MPFRSVLITGANRGIGLEFVRQFVAIEDGPRNVFACCRDPSKASELAKIVEETGDKVHVVRLDVTNDQQMAEAVKYVEDIVGEDGLNLIINNAGILERDGTKLPNIDRALLVQHFNVNAASPVLVTQAFLGLLRKSASQHEDDPMSVFRSGVVNISSGVGSITNNTTGTGMTGYGYRMSKAALNMATKCLSVDLKLDRILFVSLCPGWVQTDMGGQRAMLTPHDSISSMLTTFKQFTDDHSGGYFQRDGAPLAP